ncbi:MAG: hypothetical protein WC130_04895 [Kiritimatiellia bacterium]
MAKRSDLIAALKALASKLGNPPKTIDLIKAKNKGLNEYILRKEFGSYSNALKAAGLLAERRDSSKPAPEIAPLKARIKELENALDSEERRSRALSKFSGMVVRDPPKWLNDTSQKKGIMGIPLLFISDVHFDEVVNIAEINGANSYNREIAVKRLERTFRMATWLCHNQFAAPKYDGIVCALGGDMVSGNIHEELAETNQHRILRTCLDLSRYLAAGLRSLADSFGEVYVPCVTGNHGRIKKQWQCKNRSEDNFDWLIYQMVGMILQDDKRIKIHAPVSPDVQFDIHGLKFLLTHGDQFKGGSGIAGVFSPLMLGAHRKQKRQSALDKPFDIMMMGHWHQLIQTQSLIVNGSVKGYDEYAFQNNFPPEPAQQSLSIISRDGRITHNMPVFCDAPEVKQGATPALVAW